MAAKLPGSGALCLAVSKASAIVEAHLSSAFDVWLLEPLAVLGGASGGTSGAASSALGLGGAALGALHQRRTCWRRLALCSGVEEAASEASQELRWRELPGSEL